MTGEARPDADARGHRFCLVAARFNEDYVARMVSAALDVLRGRGATEDDLRVVWVPGSFELPLACRWAASTGRYDAVLAFGVLIEGETDHYRLVAEAATHGLIDAALGTGVPVLNGVLSAANRDLVAARTGGSHGNRGADVALAAVAMARLARSQPW